MEFQYTEDKACYRDRLNVEGPWRRKPESSQLKSREGDGRDAWWLRGFFPRGPMGKYAQFCPPGTVPFLKAVCAGHVASSESLPPRGARFARAMDDGYYLYRARYIGSCGRMGCMAEIPSALWGCSRNLLGRGAQRRGRPSISSRNIPLLRRYMGAPGNNASSFQNTISEFRADYWYRTGVLYNLKYAPDRARRSKIPVAKGCEGPPGLWHESAYAPSRYYWRKREIHCRLCKSRGRPRSRIATVRCRASIRVGHTGPVARKRGSVGGKWVANITNEKNEIAAYAIVASDARGPIREIIVGSRARRENTGEPLADVVYVDKRCSSEVDVRFRSGVWNPDVRLILDLFHFIAPITRDLSKFGGHTHKMRNPFCAYLVAAVCAGNREDVARLTDAVSRTRGLPLLPPQGWSGNARISNPSFGDASHQQRS